MPFSFRQLSIDGLVEIRPKVFGDERGYFLETYSSRDYAAAGIVAVFVQDNQSKSVKGVLRGLHFQKQHVQGKLVRAVEGEVFDVAVDLRAESPTFGKWEAVVLSATEQNQFWIPPGFAHGFLVLSDSAISAYKCTDFYHPDDEGGIRWNDPAVDISWPDVGAEPSLSAKDAILPTLASSGAYFDKSGTWIGGAR
jgi:dTDP-4-dehydrorhamnose 3,5-epimerase